MLHYMSAANVTLLQGGVVQCYISCWQDADGCGEDDKSPTAVWSRVPAYKTARNKQTISKTVEETCKDAWTWKLETNNWQLSAATFERKPSKPKSSLIIWSKGHPDLSLIKLRQKVDQKKQQKKWRGRWCCSWVRLTGRCSKSPTNLPHCRC